MIRMVATLLVGITVGAVGAFLVSDQAPRFGLDAPDSPGDSASAPAFSVQQAPENRLPTGDVDDGHDGRTRFHITVAQANQSTLLAEILELARQPDSPARRFRAEVLLSRYAELEPAKAIDLARTQGFGRSLTAALYAVWAKSNAAATLSALRNEPDANIAREAGLILVQALGDDTSALLDVLDSLPTNVDQLQFQIDVLAARAETDPGAAIAQASAFQSASDRQLALQEIAAKLGQTAPELGMSVVEQIPDEQSRRLFRGALIREWSSADPTAVFDYLETSGISATEIQALIGPGLSALARSDPERLLAIAENWPGPGGNYASQQAIAEWSKADPGGALGFVASMPPSERRDRMLSGLAGGYAQYDIDAALAWAKSLDPVPNGVYREIVSSVVDNDVDRAFEIALGLPGQLDRAEAVQAIAINAASKPSQAVEIATRLLAIPDTSVRDQSLQMLAMMWTQADAESAINWVATNFEQIPESAIQAFAHRVGQQNPQLAARFTDQVPAGARDEWIRQVASGYARYDSAGAMQWISRYQGQPAYDAAIASIAEQSARRDPIAAAQDIERNPDADYAPAVAATAGRQWARSDPRSAADWAQRLQNEHARNIAIVSVAGQWARSEPDSAAQWAMALPEGNGRDGALASAVSGVAARKVPDDRLFDAIGSDLTRQQAAIRAAYQLLRTKNSEAADRIIEQYVSDPTLKSQFLQNRARMNIY